MQKIHDKVTVFVTPRELQRRSAETDGACASTTALQYVAENAGFDVVTFRVDFSQSASIKLHRLDAASRTLHKATQEMAFECELQPFERQVLVYLVKKRTKRAFVRVQYAVTAVVTPSVDAIVQAQERTARTVEKQMQHSKRTFLDVSKWKVLPCRPTAEVAQACAEINQHSQRFGIGFIDLTFPPQSRALYDPGASNQVSDADAAVYGLCTWEHAHNIVDLSWTFVTDQTKLELPSSVSFTSGLPAQDSFLCALSVVAPYCKLWLPRWFPTLSFASQVEKMAVVPVALCDRGLRWQQFLVDLLLPSFPLGRGLMTARNVHGELYASLLHKAYAKLKGNYAAIASVSTMNILRELTGSPWVCLYTRTAEQVNTEQLQEAIEASISHRRTEENASSTLVVVTFGNIDDHHRAFRVTILSDNNSVILHDSSGEYLLKVMKANAAAFDWDQDPSALRVSWEQLSALDPVVWSLSLGCQHEKRVRRISLHEGDTVTMTVAISVPRFTAIVLSPSYSTRGWSVESQVDLDVSVAAVGADFSLTTMADINADISSGLTHSHDGVFNKQVIRTLSAGEYVVTVSAKRSGCSEFHPDTSKEEADPEGEKTGAGLTPTSTEANLQLVFDCLDREGKHELSESDITNFLQIYEHVTPSERGEAALLSFLQQRGNLLRPGTSERRLSLEDFREIYLTRALQDCQGETYTSASVRSRFQELIWQDVLRLLTSSRRGVEAESARCAIDCRYLVEMACSFHSEAPLLSVVALSESVNNI